MWESLRNLKTSEILLRKPPLGPDRDWIVHRLGELRAVAAAKFRESDSRLIVEYDADLISGEDLLEVIDACGLRPKPGRAQSAFSAGGTAASRGA
jgi:hypothetical protein